MKAARRRIVRQLSGLGAAAWAMPASIITTSALAACSADGGSLPETLAQGVVWQPDNAHWNPSGRWDALGVSDLLVQWTAVDDIAFVQGTHLSIPAHWPDWRRIAAQPWAQRVVMGLAGRFDESGARRDVPTLVAQSLQLVAAIRTRNGVGGTMPLAIDGWYFPIEVDPSWTAAPQALHAAFAALPRPLWISVYDRANVGGLTLARWLAFWLPADVGVFFQDGVGVYARDAQVARTYVDALAAQLGRDRVRVIAEAFRPLPQSDKTPQSASAIAVSGSVSTPIGLPRPTTMAPRPAAAPMFRAAMASELRPQLLAYQGYRIYLFDGPHYVSNQLIEHLLR